MLCKIENDFYSLFGFHREYLRTQTLESFVFFIKQHVWADTGLKTGCVQFFNLLTLIDMVVCKIENGFYWLVYFHYKYLRAEKFENVDFRGN